MKSLPPLSDLETSPVVLLDDGRAKPSHMNVRYSPSILYNHVCVANESLDNLSSKKATVLILGSSEGVEFSWSSVVQVVQWHSQLPFNSQSRVDHLNIINTNCVEQG